jgi:hypothetical protein
MKRKRREHEGNMKGKPVGNMQGTFRQHKENMKGTGRKHEGNMKGTLRKHKGNDCRQHAGNIMET